MIVEHSGVLAVTIAGVVVGNLRTRVDRDLREFKDQLSVMLIGLLFVLLAADVPERLDQRRAVQELTWAAAQRRESRNRLGETQLEVFQGLVLVAAATERPESRADGHGRGPGRETAVSPEPIQTLQNANERILREVVQVRFIDVPSGPKHSSESLAQVGTQFLGGLPRLGWLPQLG